MSDERVVAVGLLTANDLHVLGTGFRRCFPVSEELDFDDLLRAIDEAEARHAASARRQPPHAG